jgi:isopentenyl diphosphate isomerase/L-lactate dehydrogenase-like FMN-dependent dehydrogenase
MKKNQVTRRKALAGFGTLAAAAPLAAQAPKIIGEPPGRIAPREDLVNVLEFENVAERKLAPAVYATIAGGDRSYFERITLRPRMMVPTTNLDLTAELFGTKMFAPILVGPTARQQAFHPDGELAMVRGASAAKTAMVVSSESSYPIAAESSTTLWFQVYPEADTNSVRSRVQQAVKAGCKAICITVGAPYRNASGAPNPARLASMANPAINWTLIDQLRQGINVPVVLKGIMSPEEAAAAVKRGIQGIVVSNYGGLLTKGMASSTEMLPSIVDATGGTVPVLIDGGFRRGSDIFKALALGATAVLLGRPPLWGLAAYGPEGVQSVLEMLQTEVGRDMCHCGNPNLKAIGRNFVKLHEA